MKSSRQFHISLAGRRLQLGGVMILVLLLALVSASFALGALREQKTSTRVSIALSDHFLGSRLNASKWRVMWGTITTRNSRLRLTSRPPVSTDQTFSALVVSKKAWRNCTYNYTTRPIKALRRGAPNTWETSWGFFRYSDLAHYYYLILKPNGWELGKKHGGTLDGNAPQIFLATGSSPTFPRGRTYRVLIEAALGHIVVFVDGNKLLDYTDANPLTQGRVGLYEEDCTVDFDNVQVSGALS